MLGLWERIFSSPGSRKRFIEPELRNQDNDKDDTSASLNDNALNNNEQALLDSSIIDSELNFNMSYSDQAAMHTQAQLISHYADFYENAPDMFFSIEARTARIIQCNQTMVDTLGYPKEELVGSLIFAFYHPDCMAKVRQAFRILCETGSVRNIELQVLCKDGTPIDVSLKASSILNETGHVLYSHATWRDISDRKRAEIALRNAQEEFKEIAEADNRLLIETNKRLQAEIETLKKSEQALLAELAKTRN